jgi:hypothetical protein
MVLVILASSHDSAPPDLHALIEEAWDRVRRRRWTYAAVLALLLAGAGIWGGNKPAGAR